MEGVNNTYYNILKHATKNVSDEFEKYDIVISKKIRNNQLVVTILLTVNTGDTTHVLLECQNSADSTEGAMKKSLSEMVYLLIGGGSISLYESNYQD